EHAEGAAAHTHDAEAWEPEDGWQRVLSTTGSLGAAIANDLAGAGYTVRGWARSHKTLPGVACHRGDEQFADFLAGLD
ncbi:hypothetical protein Q6265_30825, partial [Klebsiella pneumoniae]|nr:hypothetical protein [Klebsiella pneumoniae]